MQKPERKQQKAEGFSSRVESGRQKNNDDGRRQRRPPKASLESFFGGAAREPTNFFAVRGNVFAHFLLHASTAGGVSNLFLLGSLSQA